MEISKQQEMADVSMKRPHVVILGAGASLAALPNGDRTGRRLPLMNNLVEELGLQRLISSSGLEFADNNFEKIYSALYRHPSAAEIRAQIESLVYFYFSQLRLPDSPTIYDHLLLSLREKDVVATFNWDPLLVQAYRRNGMQGRFRLPRILFLHGNVAAGYCEKDHVVGAVNTACSQCGVPFAPTQLLYPIEQKNYQAGKYIASQMGELQTHLKNAFMVSIFGYGAPESDVEAVRLLKVAWGDANQRDMEQIEIIDLKSEEELRRTWSYFIHTHHYDVHRCFYDSWIANHPRRTGEAYRNQYLGNYAIENNPPPRNVEFDMLWQWYGQLKRVEEEVSSKI
jgi:hypothetical protein